MPLYGFSESLDRFDDRRVDVHAPFDHGSVGPGTRELQIVAALLKILHELIGGELLREGVAKVVDPGLSASRGDDRQKDRGGSDSDES